jgi:hypothetical protein
MMASIGRPDLVFVAVDAQSLSQSCWRFVRVRVWVKRDCRSPSSQG